MSHRPSSPAEPGPGQGPGARYAYLRSDGTAYIVGGSAVAGVAAYLYQFLGGRTLGTEDFAPVSFLLSVHFLVLIVILMPIEQLIIRRLTLERSRTGLPKTAYWLAGLATVGATLFAALGVERFLNGDHRFIAYTALTIGVHFLFVAARGHLAGWRRFKAYGTSSAAASLVRLAIALAITLIHPSASGLALGLIIGPLVVAMWKPFRPVDVDRPELDHEARASVTDRGLLTGLVLAAAATQALLLSGPVVVGMLGGSPTEQSIAFAAFTLGRAPLVFGYNLLARVLPPFTEMAARGERQELRAWARGMAWAAIGLGAVAAVLGWALGPWVTAVFGEGFASERIDAALIATGVVFAGSGLFVGQILVARGRTVSLAIAWMAGLVAASAAIVVSFGANPITRVALGFLAGAVVSLVGLVIGAVSSSEVGAGAQAAYALTKRTIDIGVSLVILVLSVPVVLLAGLAVRLTSPGPVFFNQTRLGKNGQPFGLVKIRTMEANADEAVFAEHLARLEAARHSEEPVNIRIAGDARVTRVGRVLRKASIDEIPNFWNVLRGSMSLVGPRPLVPDEAALVGLESIRFQVKPGITGLAQVSGRDTVTLDERTRMDEEYVRTRSNRVDMRIMLRTLKAVFTELGD
jgi:exopolysaccharide production protein ExoY